MKEKRRVVDPHRPRSPDRLMVQDLRRSDFQMHALKVTDPEEEHWRRLHTFNTN